MHALHTNPINSPPSRNHLLFISVEQFVSGRQGVYMQMSCRCQIKKYAEISYTEFRCRIKSAHRLFYSMLQLSKMKLSIQKTVLRFTTQHTQFVIGIADNNLIKGNFCLFFVWRISLIDTRSISTYPLQNTLYQLRKTDISPLKLHALYIFGI